MRAETRDVKPQARGLLQRQAPLQSRGWGCDVKSPEVKVDDHGAEPQKGGWWQGGQSGPLGDRQLLTVAWSLLLRGPMLSDLLSCFVIFSREVRLLHL